MKAKFSMEVKDLLRRLLCRRADECLTAEGIREHPFFSSINWAGLVKSRIASAYALLIHSQDDKENLNEYNKSGFTRLSYFNSYQNIGYVQTP